MKLIDILTSLHSELEQARASTSSDADKLERVYSTLSERYDAISSYKLTDDVFVPGVQITELKQEIKASRNTFYSIYTGFLDDEINLSSYHRQLGILSVKVQEAIDKVSKAYVSASIINLTRTLPEVKTIEHEVEASTDPVKVYKNLQEMQIELKTAKKEANDAANEGWVNVVMPDDIDKAENYQIEHLRRQQGAPITPEGYRRLQDKNKPSHDPEEAYKQKTEVEKSRAQDETQFHILKEYQESLSKLVHATTPTNMDWTITKGPIFFSSNPPINERQVKGLNVKYSPFFPGWILDNQFLLGIKPSMLKDKKQLVFTLKTIRQTMAQRFHSDFVYMVVPNINNNVKEPIIKKLTDKEQDALKNTKTVKDLNKKLKSRDRKLDTQIVKEAVMTDLPKFIPLTGSKLVWTWLMPVHKFAALPRIRVRDFGFPAAPNLRGMDERLAKRSNPELKNSTIHIDSVVKEFRLKIEKEYAEQSEPIDKEIDEIQTKIKTVDGSIADLVRSFQGDQLTLQELIHDKSLAATSALRDKYTASIKAQEDKISALSGRINGFKGIVKDLRAKTTSLKAQKIALISRIRQEATEGLKQARQGKQPEGV